MLEIVSAAGDLEAAVAGLVDAANRRRHRQHHGAGASMRELTARG